MARKNGDDAYAGRRDEDRAQWWVGRFLERAAWPLAALFLVVLAIASYLFVTSGQAKAIAYLQFLQGPLVTALLGLVITGLTMIVSKVPQLGRIDRRLGETQKQVAETARESGVSAERVDTIARFAEQLSAKVDRLDERLDERLDALSGPDRGTVLAEVRAAVEDGFGDILVTARAATAQRTAVPPAARPEPEPEPVVYAEPVAQWEPPAAPFVPEPEPPAPEASGTSVLPPLPPLRPEPGPPTPWTPLPATAAPDLDDAAPHTPPPGGPVDALDTRYPWLRDPTGQLRAVPGDVTGALLRTPDGPISGMGDLPDDGDDDGLPEHIRVAFREAMQEQRDAEQRAYEARSAAARRAWHQYPPAPPTLPAEDQ